MAFYSDLLTLIDDAITKRAQGGFVEHFNVLGTDISVAPIETLMKLRGQVADMAAGETGGRPRRFALARLNGLGA